MEHLHHPNPGEMDDIGEVRHFVDPSLYPTMIGGLATVAAASVSGYFSYKASKNSKEAKFASEESRERSKLVAEIRNEIDASQDTVDNALVDVIEELAWALKRDGGIGNGELADALSRLRGAQAENRQVKSKASKNL